MSSNFMRFHKMLNQTFAVNFRCTMCCIFMRRCYFGLETRVIIKIEYHSFYPKHFDWFSSRWSKRNPRWLTQKTWVFQIHQFSIFFHQNFRDWSLGEYDKLIPRALMWLNLYGRQAVQCKVNLLLKWPYVGQPDDHLGWATSMPFTSTYPIHPRTKPLNFGEQILRIGGFEKLSFLRRPFWFFFLHSHENQSKFIW